MKIKQLNTTLRRYFFGFMAMFLLSWQTILPASASATHTSSDKIQICHRTASYSNPYVEIEVDKNAADGQAGNSGQEPDHYDEHKGPIFYPSIPKHTEWGDIIPPISNVHSGQNWTAEGQAIWNNDCKFPKRGDLEVNKKVDANGDGVYEGGNTTANNLGFKWLLDGDTTENNMGTKLQNIVAGDHTVTENDVAGYKFTGWYYTYKTETNNCSNPVGTTLPLTVEVKDDKTTYITLCNQKVKGKITVHKVTDPANDQTEFSITATGSGTIDGNATRSLTTAQDIVYDVSEGTYDVNEQVPEGWKQTSNTCEDLVINANSPSASCTITNTKLAKLKIVKDAKPNGSQEFGFTSNTLSGFSLVDDGSAANTKQFTNLNPGTYDVTETAVSGWDLSNLWCDNEDWNSNGSTLTVELTAGDDVTCKFVNEKRSGVNGSKFEDKNGNGNWDEGEPTLGGWTINLYACTKEQEVPSFNAFSVNNAIAQLQECDDSPTATTFTDENGEYGFDNLLPGSYKVCEVNQAGWTQTYPADNNGCHMIEICRPGESVTVDFGNFKKASVKGYKWNDANGNATPDVGEQKLSGWTITLYKNDGEDNWNEVDSTKTDTNGDYSFTGLEVGNYMVCETQQSGWTRTFPTNNDCQEFSVVGSDQECIANFGNKQNPGQVLSASTPAQVVNTGANSLPSLMVGLMIIGVLGAVMRVTAYGRKLN